MSVATSPKNGDVIRYINNRLDEDIIPDAMDDSLEADILRKIPKDISDMYVKTIPGKYPQIIH